MVLTGHELTAASSAVAVLAILGGYLGVRSATGIELSGFSQLAPARCGVVTAAAGGATAVL
jgi:hypothetical protein